MSERIGSDHDQDLPEAPEIVAAFVDLADTPLGKLIIAMFALVAMIVIPVAAGIIVATLVALLAFYVAIASVVAAFAQAIELGRRWWVGEAAREPA